MRSKATIAAAKSERVADRRFGQANQWPYKRICIMLMGQFIKKRAGLIQNVAITSTCTLRCSAVMAGVPPLTPDEVKAELAKLTTLAGVELRPEVFDVLVELTRLDVVPTATAQVLKSLCVKSAMRASVGGGSGGASGGR